MDGNTYQSQTVTSRTQSTYENVLTINTSLLNIDIINHTYTCSVTNVIATDMKTLEITGNYNILIEPVMTCSITQLLD